MRAAVKPRGALCRHQRQARSRQASRSPKPRSPSSRRWRVGRGQPASPRHGSAQGAEPACRAMRRGESSPAHMPWLALPTTSRSVAAFMRGLNRTRGLKFDHPGLDTTAIRGEDRGWSSRTTSARPTPMCCGEPSRDLSRDRSPTPTCTSRARSSSSICSTPFR